MVNILIKYRYILPAFVILIFFNISILKGIESEKDVYEPYSSRILLKSMLPNPTENSFYIELQSTSRSNSLGYLSDLQEYQDESIDTNLINGLSKSYVAAFRQELDEEISRSEALKYFISLAGSLGPIIPQLAVARTMAQQHFHSDLVGYVMIGTGALTISAINSWMISELIDDTYGLIKSTRQPQKDLSSCSSVDCLKNIGIGASSIVLGTFSSVANVYLNYKYNNNKWFSLITLVYDAIPKIIGFYKFSELLKVDNIKRIWEKPDLNVKRGIQIINLSQAHFLEKCKEKGIEAVRENLISCSSANEVYLYLTSNTNLESTKEELPHHFERGIPKKVIKYSSIFLPLVSSSFNITLAYKGYKLILRDELSLWLLSILSVAPSFFLSSYVIMQAVENVFDKIYLCRSPIPPSDCFASFHPKSNVTLMSTALMLASVSSFVAYYLITDNLEDTLLNSVKYPIASIIMATGFTFDTFTIYTSLKRYGELAYKKFGKGAPYVINCSKNLSNLNNSLINSSPALIKKFVDEATPEYENSWEQNELLPEVELVNALSIKSSKEFM